MKILVVEDEIKIANLIKKVIEMDHYVVDLANSGKDGLFKAEKNNYDLIILDIMLPEIDGIEICRTLRRKKIKTPIIMLTALDTIEDRLTATEAGADDYLSKPFVFEELIARMKTLLARGKNDDAVLNVKNTNYSKDMGISGLEEERFVEINKRIMDNIPVSIITIDRDGFMTSANRYFKNLSKHEDYRKNNVFTGKFFIRENLVDDYKKLMEDGTMVKRENCYERNVDGEDKYLKIVAIPLLSKEGQIEGAVSMALDNTEAVLYKKELQELNKELEEKVRQRTAELDEANKELGKVLELKSMFVADVSHEMRTSLAIVQGNAELMSRGLIEEGEHEETYGQIFGEIKRMSTMLSDLTLLSDSESSRHSSDFEKININNLISSVCKSLRVVANEKNIEIQYKQTESEIEFMADPGQLEKLLMNLVRNAIRYNKENGSINVWVEEVGNEIKLNVQDSGIGISKEHLPNIFERFYRVDKARTRSEGGSGLGLAICKWIAEIHGGSIEVSSQVGKGSLFEVRLPRVQGILIDKSF